MTLEEYCIYAGEIVGPEKTDWYNIRGRYLGDGVPSAKIKGYVYVVLDDGCYRTPGSEDGNGGVFVHINTICDPLEAWEFVDTEDIIDLVVQMDGRLFGPCGNCGELTSKPCLPEFEYLHGKVHKSDSLPDDGCSEMACFDCRWCHRHKEHVLHLINHWGGRPTNVTGFNTYYREWDDPFYRSS